MGTPAVAPLIECLNNQDNEIASGACNALVKIGTPAVKPLIAYMKRNMQDKTTPQETSRTNSRRRPSLNLRRRLPTRRNPLPMAFPIMANNSFFRPHLVIKALGEIGDSRAVEPLLAYMKKAGKSCSPSAAVALGRLGDSRAVELLIDRLDQTRLGAASALALTKLSGEKALEHVVPLLTQWGAYDELIFAISRLGWRPQNEAEHVYVWAATDNKGELLSNWEQTKRILLPDLKNEYKAQRAIEIFLELKKDDSAVVSSLLSLLRDGDSESVSLAQTFLHCGHARLVDAAANLLVKKGYKVTYVSGTRDQYGNVISSISYDKETTPPDVWQRMLRKDHSWK